MKHTTTYTLVIKLIKAGKTDGLADKVDVYYAAGRLTDEEYEEIMGILMPAEEVIKEIEETEAPAEEDPEE